MDVYSQDFRRALIDYAEANSTQEYDYLYRLRRATYLKTLAPQMLSGHLQGNLLSMISKMVAPAYIVEIGTFTGYASLCLASGLQANGRLITIEANQELQHISQPSFDESPYGHLINQWFGDAKTLIDELDGGIDLVFLDAGKRDYPYYFKQLIGKVRPGGFILADNVLWNGKVIYEKEDPVTQTLMQFNTMILEDERVEQLILPIRDGINIIRKKP